MELLGVEFVEYAGFKRQFVPLMPGINLLAGRNNAGKTALLHGITFLNGLPFEQKGAADGVALRYAQQQTPFQQFGLDAIVRADAAELNAILKIFDSGEQEVPLKKGVLIRVRFMACGQQLDFVEAVLFHPSDNILPSVKDLRMIQSNFPSAESITAAELVSLPDCGFLKTRMVQKGTRYNNETGAHLNLDYNYPIFAPLRSAIRCFFVEPHRVPMKEQDVKITEQLEGSGRGLPAFLHTLQNNNRPKFQSIEKFVTTVFPEFDGLYTPLDVNTQTSIQLHNRALGRRLPLDRCGTGVEQMLILATFVLTSPEGTTFLLDEPHSNLHPTAERQLLNFLKEHPEHRYVVSTHSAVLINGVGADRVTYIAPPGQALPRDQNAPEVSNILFDLGYRNSDAIFNSRLIIAEGPSDQKILPILLKTAGILSDDELDKTGVAQLEGIGKGLRQVQTAISRYEKLIVALRRDLQPRLYLLDGDRRAEDRPVIERQTNPVTRRPISVAFLPRTEIENYLLVPEAVALGLSEEAELSDVTVTVSADDVRTIIAEELATDDKTLFPWGKGLDPAKTVKGSVLLDRIYQKFQLNYQKTSGHLIAKHITKELQPALAEFHELLKPLLEAQI